MFVDIYIFHISTFDIFIRRKPLLSTNQKTLGWFRDCMKIVIGREFYVVVFSDQL